MIIGRMGMGKVAAVAAGIALLLASAPAHGASLPDPLKDPAAFANPPRDARPGYRWWWSGDVANQTAVDIGAAVKEVDAMAKAGFGRFEIAWDSPGYGTQTQRDHLKTVLDEAKKDDIGLDMTLGVAWPWGTPDNTGDAATLDLMYGRKDFDGPQHISEQAPPALDDSNNQRTGKLIAVTAARVITPGPTAAVDKPPATSTILDPSSLVDLTSKTAPDGTVTWDVPAGHWILFSFWQRQASTNVNPMDGHSTEVGLNWAKNNQVGEVGKDLKGIGGSFFEDSLEYSADELYWSTTLPQEFSKRRGYDMTKYLPLMFVETVSDYWVPQDEPVPDFDLPDKEGARYRHDYYETITDLYVEDHLVPMEKWAEQFGMKYRSQPAYGNPFDVIRSARGLTQAGGLADDESLNAGDTPFVGGVPGYLERDNPWGRFAMDHYRQVASGSFQGGSLEISSELGAWFTKDLGIGSPDLREMMDKEWAFGITRPILHGYTNTPDGFPWPGREHFNGLVGHSLNYQTSPQWQLLRPLTDYWARGAMVLQQGRPRTDVAILRDNFVTTEAGPADPQKIFFDSHKLEDAGYTVGYIDPDGLRDAPTGRSGRLYPNSVGYQALIIDSKTNYVGPGRIPGATAQAIDAASKKGLRVVIVGAPPSRGTNGADPAAEDAKVQQAMAAIVARPTTRVVATQSDAAAAVHALALRPASEWPSAQPVFSQRRQTANADYYYLWNANPKPVSFTASFVGRGYPTRLDLWTGKTEGIAARRAAGGRFSVPIALGPRENMVLAFAKGNRAATGPAVQSVAQGPITVKPWQLDVESWGPEGQVPIPAQSLDTLSDWRDIPALKAISGIGTYTATVNVPADWLASGRAVRLDLGTVDGAIQTYVNGQLASPDINGFSTIDTTPYLKPGANAIKVVLATTLLNRARVTPSFVASRPIDAAEIAQGDQAYGLLGPVRLLPVALTAVPASASAPSRKATCKPRRRIVAHVRAPRGFHVRSVRVRVAGKARHAKVTRKRPWFLVTITVKGRLPRRAAKVSAVIRARDGRVLRVRRTLWPCRR